jgi:ubiquitin-like domain-containing CTD phosphatase 1
MRPFLHEFLTSAYEDYDIVIWSATGMKWIEEKMRLLGVSTHQDYKIMFYLDYLAMITVHTAKYGTIDVSKDVLLSYTFHYFSFAMNTYIAHLIMQ